MDIVDISVRRIFPDPPPPEEWTEEQRAAINEWLNRVSAEFASQAMAQGCPTRIWIDETGQMQIESIDPMAIQAGPDPAAAAAGAEPGQGRADPAPVEPHWPFTYCGN